MKLYDLDCENCLYAQPHLKENVSCNRENPGYNREKALLKGAARLLAAILGSRADDIEDAVREIESDEDVFPLCAPDDVMAGCGQGRWIIRRGDDPSTRSLWSKEDYIQAALVSDPSAWVVENPHDVV